MVEPESFNRCNALRRWFFERQERPPKRSSLTETDTTRHKHTHRRIHTPRQILTPLTHTYSNISPHTQNQMVSIPFIVPHIFTQTSPHTHLDDSSRLSKGATWGGHQLWIRKGGFNLFLYTMILKKDVYWFFESSQKMRGARHARREVHW